MSRQQNQFPSRRTILKGMGLAPLIFRSAPFLGSGFLIGPPSLKINDTNDLAFHDPRLIPHYPAKSPLADILLLVSPGSDEYLTEKYAFEIDLLLQQWGKSLKSSPRDHSVLAKILHRSIEASPLVASEETTLRSRYGIETRKRKFSAGTIAGRDRFLDSIGAWLAPLSQIETAEFEITDVEQIAAVPLTLRLEIRYDLVGVRTDHFREERIGTWTTIWLLDLTDTPLVGWKASKWHANGETSAIVRGPAFSDITAHALAAAASYPDQMLRGVDHWRTILDGACGIDVYGNNGIAAGDFDNDGFDDFYVCQPAGLPNRLYRNRGDGTFEDVTEKSGVGVLDSTACALFADFENKGRQDLLVVCGGGPMLFVNQGNRTFVRKADAFEFARPPQGSFTHAAIADYDGDGRLDIYFCTYSYYLGLDQYHYPVPYFDARNGPANYLLHNEGNLTFVDRTEAAGLNVDNDRYSFACAWGHATSNGLPDLYVANDFGRSNLYRNKGDGTFTATSADSHVEDPGAGMSASWSDFDNNGNQDIYVANMWSSAGQRVSAQKQFHEKAPEEIRALYRHHARGNSLYRNQGNGTFRNIATEAGVEMGRWAWSSDFWDFDHDGYPDLYVANGYISGPDNGQTDLGSFFWRQVVARSPEDNAPSLAYEHGWNALNELIRSDGSWSGYEKNVLFVNNGDGTFSEASGAVGLDFLEDGRSFVLADLDHDGRLELIIKNRNTPQLRILHNDMTEIGRSIIFRLRGVKSNRDAVGAAITIEAADLRQTRYLQAGSGFLSQHSKEMLFGLGKNEASIRATILWPSGITQVFENLPTNQRIEIEEGSSRFIAKPFVLPRPYSALASPASQQPLPHEVETWLIEPLKAPDFTLPDLSGNLHQLSSQRGGSVLLALWQAIPICLTQLKLIQQHRSSFASAGLTIIALNVDAESSLSAARSFVAQQRLEFPVLFATDEVAGIYNILYRFLYDRRRDLSIPTSFLLDKEGMIVKIYQGSIDPKRVVADEASMPLTPAERTNKALPFRGELHQGSFQRNDFTYGVALFQHGYLDEAAASFEQVVAAKPDDPEAYYNLGTLYLRKSDLKQARHYLEQTVRLRSNYPEAWNNLGMIEAQEGHSDEAVQNFKQSLSLRPNYAVALLNLGNLLRRQGSFDKALEYLMQALELQPDDPEISYSLGMLYAQHGQTDRASAYLHKAIELRPDYPEALNNLGVLFVHMQNYSQAEVQFTTCIRLAPNFDQSYLNLARLYVMQNNKLKAREVLQQLVHLQPQNATAKQAMELLQ